VDGAWLLLLAPRTRKLRQDGQRRLHKESKRSSLKHRARTLHAVISATIGNVVEAVTGFGSKGIEKSKLVAAVMKETNCGKTHAYDLVKKAESKKAIIRRKDDKLYVVPSR
jgi:hypothetical protein